MDILNRLLKLIDHNRYTALGLVLFAAIVVYGCTPPTTDFMGEQVNRTQLEQRLATSLADIEARQAIIDAEREALVANATAADDDLQMQAEKRAAMLDVAGNLVLGIASGGLNPAAIGTGIATLLGIFGGGGAFLDNRRKDREFKKLREKREAPATA